MESIITILFLTILVITVYGLKMYQDKDDLKKCTTKYILKKEEKKQDPSEKILLNNVDNLSYLDFF